MRNAAAIQGTGSQKAAHKAAIKADSAKNRSRYAAATALKARNSGGKSQYAIKHLAGHSNAPRKGEMFYEQVADLPKKKIRTRNPEITEHPTGEYPYRGGGYPQAYANYVNAQMRKAEVKQKAANRNKHPKMKRAGHLMSLGSNFGSLTKGEDNE